MISHSNPMNPQTQVPDTEPWLEIVRKKVDAMRFGSVQIIVHEGRVTQVESTEKTRLPGDSANPISGQRRPTTL